MAPSLSASTRLLAKTHGPTLATVDLAVGHRLEALHRAAARVALDAPMAGEAVEQFPGPEAKVWRSRQSGQSWSRSAGATRPSRRSSAGAAR